MATKKKSPARITLRTVLEHVQHMHQDILRRFGDHDKKFVLLEQKMDTQFKAVHEKIGAAERRLTLQIDGIDKRLDDVEIKEIPKLKKAVGAR